MPIGRFMSICARHHDTLSSSAFSRLELEEVARQTRPLATFAGVEQSRLYSNRARET